MAQVRIAWCLKNGPSYKVFKHWSSGTEAIQTITGFQGDLLTRQMASAWMSRTSLKQRFLVGGSR